MIRDESDEDVDLEAIPPAEALDEDFEQDPRANRDVDDDDDKKKLGLKTTYEGFSIWGWVLCLFIERKGGPGKKSAGAEGNAQALMQDWIVSTQEQRDDDL